MKNKNKLFGIIVVLGIIAFVGYFSPLGNLMNQEETHIKEVINKNSITSNNYTLLVNKQYMLGKDYVPKNLEKLNIDFLSDTSEESKYMVKKAADALEDLVETAKEENITLIGSSAYRSYKSQERVLNQETNSKGTVYANKYVAKPGQSEHQSGLAIDVTNKARCFDKTSVEAQWLAKNAYRFGFILRYPEGKENITGYNYEPWHIRYVGKSVAKNIYKGNITLEEYLK